MTKDKSTAIALLGIGAVALYALTRQQKTDDMGVFPDAWGGGSATLPTPETPETPPTTGITPIINFPEVPPYVEQQPPAWLFYPPLPSPDYTATDYTASTHKKETVPPAITTPTTTYTTGDPIHPSIGPSGGFGGGGTGGRGDTQSSGGIGDVLKSLFSPLALLARATPFGIVAAVPQAGLALATAVTKKEATTTTVTAPTTTVAPFTGSTVSSSITATPSKEISSFYSAGADYTVPVDTTKKGSAVTTVYESGAYQTISQGQIVSAGSAGSTAPPASAPSTGAAHAAATGQVYSPPGSSLGGSTGTVMSKKSASILSGDSDAAKAWRKRYGGG